MQNAVKALGFPDQMMLRMIGVRHHHWRLL